MMTWYSCTWNVYSNTPDARRGCNPYDGTSCPHAQKGFMGMAGLVVHSRPLCGRCVAVCQSVVYFEIQMERADLVVWILNSNTFAFVLN